MIITQEQKKQTLDLDHITLTTSLGAPIASKI